MKQNREITDLLWDLVRGHRDGGDDAEMHIRHEGRRDQHAVEDIVETIADQNERGGGGITAVIVIVRHVTFAQVQMAVAPQHQLLEHKENEQTA